MKARIFAALFLLLLLFSSCALGEIILWEDENGQLILQDGELTLVSPQDAALLPLELTPEPSAGAALAQKYALDTPLPQAEQPEHGGMTLSSGDTGAAVEQLQSRLAELGFFGGKITGGYYKITKTAVRDFQRHNGLAADGVAGPQTLALLYSQDALPAHAAPLPTATPQPTKYTLMVDVANQIVRAYTYDENGEYTVLVREMVCSSGKGRYATPLGTTIMPAKRARWGYFPTWGSHAQYLTRIDAANAFHSVLYREADERTLSTQSFEDLGEPASHGCVRLIVSDAKWIYDNCKAGTIITVYEGPYDPEYTMSIKPTLNMNTLRENPLPAPTPTPVYSRENWPTSYRTLYRGKSGEDVFMVQMRLKELGYYNGTITGGYYGGTIAAVKAFQKDNGLSVDGSAGAKTQALLFSSAFDPTPIPTAAPTATPQPTATPIPTPTPQPTATPEPTIFIPIEDSVG